MNRRRVFITSVALVGLTIGWFVVRPIIRTVRGLPTAYALWDVGASVINHMETHGGAWPRDWDDVRAAHRDLYRRGDFRAPPGDLERLVSVDFGSDPRRLRDTPWAEADRHGGRPPFWVIAPRSGSQVTWEGAEPNEMVWQYLHGQYHLPRNAGASTLPATQPDPPTR